MYILQTLAKATVGDLLGSPTVGDLLLFFCFLFCLPNGYQPLDIGGSF